MGALGNSVLFLAKYLTIRWCSSVPISSCDNYPGFVPAFTLYYFVFADPSCRRNKDSFIHSNRVEYRLILCREGRRLSWLKSGDVAQDRAG